jgi:hypothetical protein
LCAKHSGKDAPEGIARLLFAVLILLSLDSESHFSDLVDSESRWELDDHLGRRIR